MRLRPNCFGGRPFVRGKIQRLKGSTDDAGGVLMPGTARETGVLDVGRGPGRFAMESAIGPAPTRTMWATRMTTARNRFEKPGFSKLIEMTM